MRHGDQSPPRLCQLFVSVHFPGNGPLDKLQMNASQAFIVLRDLLPETVYNVRIVAESQAGQLRSKDERFETRPPGEAATQSSRLQGNFPQLCI